MMRRFIPREVAFFDDFERQSAHIVRAASLLQDLLTQFSDVRGMVSAIKDVEHAGDQVTHALIARLRVTFVTPMDRRDLHILTERLDDVLDYIDAAASAVSVYRVKRPTPESRGLVAVVVRSVAAVDEAVKCLRTVDPTFYRLALEVHEQEHNADELLRQSLGSLFEGGGDVIEILKWKEIYETLEGITDRCEDVTNTIETIMLKEGVRPAS
jgi:predicted phosphate transport protein (TIGR00153 family)